MHKFRVLVKGHNILGQLGISNNEFIKEFTPLTDFDGKYIKRICTNFGQTFLLIDNLKSHDSIKPDIPKNEIFRLGAEFGANNIIKALKGELAPGPIQYLTNRFSFLKKYAKKAPEEPMVISKISIPNDIIVKNIQTGLGNLYVIDESGRLLVRGENQRGQLGF